MKLGSRWLVCWTIVWLIAGALVACGSYEDSTGELRERSWAISNGTQDPGHASVGTVIDSKYTSLCTGTLVGNKTVLTAAHCVEKGAPFTFTAGGTAYPVAKATLHPQYPPSSGIHNIAVLQLASAPPIASSPVNASTPTVGMKVVLVGYGATAPTASDQGNKRSASNSLLYVQPNTIYTGSGASVGNLCGGDGGAPFFATIAGKEVQIGVGVGSTQDCTSGSGAVRVDVFLPWIKTASGGDLNTGQGAPKDTAPPKVTITAPKQGATVTKSITVRAQITDNFGVTKAELLVDGQPGQTQNKAPYDFSINLTAGEHTLKVVGYDAAGNTGSAAVTVTADASTGDNQAPVVIIDHPAAGSTVGPSFTLTAQITDNVGVSGAELWIDGAVSASRSAPPFHFPINLGAGPHTLRVLGRDAAGNTGEASVTVTVGQGGAGPDPGSGGCSLAQASGSGNVAGWCSLPTLLALLILSILRRRRP